MKRHETPRPNDPAPELSFDVLGVPESHWDLSSAEANNFSLLLFYRGLHCPVCRSYLKAFDAKVPEFLALGTEPVALSMDDTLRAQKAKSEWAIENLPIGYGLTEDVARDWGLFISESIKDDEPKRFSEPGLFLVKPDRRLHYVAINSMPFGRPAPGDILSAVRFILDQGYPARGTVPAGGG